MQALVNPFFLLCDPFTDGTKFIPYYLQTWKMCIVLQVFEVMMNNCVVNNITREVVLRTDKEGMAGACSAVGNVSVSSIKEAVITEDTKQGL